MILNYDERSTIKLKRSYTESHTNVDNNAEVLQQLFYFLFFFINWIISNQNIIKYK